jgi:hypothetical protein
MVLSYLWLIHDFWLRHVFTEDHKPGALHFDKTIAADPTVEVTLVSRENFLLFTPMLHEVAAGDLDLSDIVSPLRQMLKKRALSAGGRGRH